MDALSGIILAGGQSRRLGRDKRRLRLWGEQGPTLLERTTELLHSLCAEVIVVLNDAAAWPNLQAQLIPDRYPGAGALGGIFTGLVAAHHPHALVVAADMPLLNLNLLRAMSNLPRNYDALVPRSPQPAAARNPLALEPLHAIYSRACLEPLRQLLEQRQYRISDLLQQVRLVIMTPEEYAPFDPFGYSFLNINTAQELALVQQLLKAPNR